MHRASVQVFAFDEPQPQLAQTFESIRALDVPGGWTVDLEAWITPTGDDDPSFATARDAGFEAHRAPKGKLSARNAAHDHAVDDVGADAIVAWDADAPPISDQTLVAFLEPLESDRIVATNSNPWSSVRPDGWPSLPGVAIDAAARLEDHARPHLHGQAAAITAEGWRSAGPFDDGRDQTDGKTVRAEEEIAFHARLEDVGYVVDVDGAVIYNDPRRHYCDWLPALAPDGYCDARGVETFQRGVTPRRRHRPALPRRSRRCWRRL